MTAKLLAVFLCLTGMFPQRACCCVPVVIGCQEAGCRGSEPGPPAPPQACSCRGHDDGDADAAGGSVDSRAHRHERHQDHCPAVRPSLAEQTTPPSKVVTPSPDLAPASFGSDDRLPAAPRPLRPSARIDGSPPHVPLFLSLLVLRN